MPRNRGREYMRELCGRLGICIYEGAAGLNPSTPPLQIVILYDICDVYSELRRACEALGGERYTGILMLDGRPITAIGYVKEVT